MSQPYRGGFTGHGFGTFYNLLLPGLQGREKRAFFNRACGWLLLSCCLIGTVFGWMLAGPLGGFIGFGIGLGAGGTYTEKSGFYRR